MDKDNSKTVKKVPAKKPEKNSTVRFDPLKVLNKKNKNDKEEPKKEKKNSSRIFKRYDHNAPFFIGSILTVAKIIGLCLVIIAFAGVGAVYGVAQAYLETTPELDLVEIGANDLTSYIYDSKGALITTYAGVENRDYATLDEIPLDLQHAVVAIEDIRFYSHKGIDIKGMLSAFIGNLSSNSVSGGSTITQQLIKNKLLTNEKSYKRKIQEMSLAMQLEKVYTKDQILEAYLNTIPLGGMNYGVKAAALDYFGKTLDQLTLRETACLAGITQFPYSYNPRTAMYRTNNMKLLNKRIDRVLTKMYENNFITKEQLEAALKDDIEVLEYSIVSDLYDYPHFVEYSIYDVITHLLRMRDLEDTTANRKAVSNELRTSGYHIYTTIDPAMQELVQKTLSEATYPKLSAKNTVIIDPAGNEIPQPQAAAVVLEQSTGQLKAIVGGRYAPTTMQSFNRAYQSRMPVGSSIKPLAVYGPAFDKGYGLGSIIENIPAKIPGWGTAAGHPTTSVGTYGPTTIRKGIVSSLNIVAARTLMTRVGIDTSYNYLVNLGVSTEKLNADGVGLALGSSGITVIEMAGGYGCIANGGEYREPLSFTKVIDSSGNVVMDADEVRIVKQVYKPSSAFMLVEALTNAVQSGTGWRAKIKGMTTCGKTGTVANNRGTFFAGFTPYYVSTIWVGHDGFQVLPHSYGGDTAAPIWKTYMSALHEGLEDKKVLEGTAASYGVVKKSVCAVSGLKPHAGCPTVSDYFPKDGGPKESCNMHASAQICTVSGELAGIYCPPECIKTGSGVVIPPDSPYAELSDSELRSIFRNYIRTAKNSEQIICSYHTYEWACMRDNINAAKNEAAPTLNKAKEFLEKYKSKLKADQITSLTNAINAMQHEINNTDATLDSVHNAHNNLSKLLTTLETYIKSLPPDPPPGGGDDPPGGGDDPGGGDNPGGGDDPGGGDNPGGDDPGTQTGQDGEGGKPKG